jgi:hypothetical protein
MSECNAVVGIYHRAAPIPSPDGMGVSAPSTDVQRLRGATRQA